MKLKLTSAYNINNSWNSIEVDWQAASGPGNNDGRIQLWLDGVSKKNKTGIGSDTRGIDRVRLGWPAAVASNSGTIYFDNFVSETTNYIGPYPWGSAVTLDSNAGNSSASISIYDTTGHYLYAFWIRSNTVYYKKGISPYTSAYWDTNPTTIDSAGTNTSLTSSTNDFISGKIFMEYTGGDASPYEIKWTSISINQTPTAPTTLYLNESDTGAQLGVSNPVAVGASNPVFSAIFNDSDSGDIANKYELIVYSDVACTSSVWDSGSSGTSMTNCTQGNRCGDVSFGGTALALNGVKYYWKIRLWDQAGQVGAFSDCTANFTILGPDNQMGYGNYFFNNTSERIFTW